MCIVIALHWVGLAFLWTGVKSRSAAADLQANAAQEVRGISVEALGQHLDRPAFAFRDGWVATELTMRYDVRRGKGAYLRVDVAPVFTRECAGSPAAPCEPGLQTVLLDRGCSEANTEDP